MTTFTIHSRKLNQDFTFNLDESQPRHSKYVRLEKNGKTFTLAPQICYGGGFTWYRQYMASERAEN
jgi:hypothetical protein